MNNHHSPRNKVVWKLFGDHERIRMGKQRPIAWQLFEREEKITQDGALFTIVLL